MKYIMLKNLENKIANFISTEIEWVPINSVDIQNDEKESVIEFLENLEDDDDISERFFKRKFGKHLMLIIGIDPGISGSICFRRWNNQRCS